MLNIDENGIISLNRGDDVSFTVTLRDETGKEYVLEEGDELIFSVKASPEEDSPVLVNVRSVTGVILLSRADTIDLDVGRYSAGMCLKRAGGETLTVFPALSRHGRTRAWNNFLLDPEAAIDEGGVI